MKAIKASLWTRFIVPLVCLLFVLPVLTATASDARPCDGGLGHPNRGKNFILDLSSSMDSVRLSRQVFRKTGLDEVTINVGGVDKILRPNDIVTAAEFIAAGQVLRSGSQAIVLDNKGVATGGDFSVNQVIQPGHLSSMVIPGDVVGIWTADKPVYNITRVLQLQDDGILVGVTGKRDALTIRTGGLDVGSMAKLTTVVTQDLVDLVSALAPNLNQKLDLNLFTQCSCTIRSGGEISASGNLLIDTKTSIVNAGTIMSTQGSVTLTGTPGQDLLINNVGGTITALAGDINFRLPNFSASSALDVVGGTLAVFDSHTINVNGGNGSVAINVDDIIGLVQGRSGSAVISTTVDTGLLQVGTFTASRGGITLSGAGAVAINPLNDPEHLLAAQNVGDVQITAFNGDITLGNGTNILTNGGNIIALASGNIDGGTGITLTARAANPPGNSNNFDSGGIHLGAGLSEAELTGNTELVTLLHDQPAPFFSNVNPSAIGATLNNNGTGRLQVNLNGGAINLDGSTININGGVVLLETAGSGEINMHDSTLNTFLPVSYVAETSAPGRQDEAVIDTGEDDPGVFDEEVVAAN